MKPSGWREVGVSKECNLEIWISKDRPTECDGCGDEIPAGTPHVSGIESCCGGGCCRVLCFDCIARAAALIAKANQAKAYV